MIGYSNSDLGLLIAWHYTSYQDVHSWTVSLATLGLHVGFTCATYVIFNIVTYYNPSTCLGGKLDDYYMIARKTWSSETRIALQSPCIVIIVSTRPCTHARWISQLSRESTRSRRTVIIHSHFIGAVNIILFFTWLSGKKKPM